MKGDILKQAVYTYLPA